MAREVVVGVVKDDRDMGSYIHGDMLAGQVEDNLPLILLNRLDVSAAQLIS